MDGTSQVDYFKAAIQGLIEVHQPLWVRLAPGGREHVLQAVNINGTQCFRNAGLLETPPGREVSDWWDALAARIRNERDARLLDIGREGERRSLEFERSRLRDLGIDREPRWESIENNDAGYDILSYNPGPVEPISKIIEVKSSTQEPPCIFITRGEWNAALTYGDAYVFQVWSVGAIKPLEISVASMAAHVPRDQGVGSWLKVAIAIEAN